MKFVYLTFASIAFLLGAQAIQDHWICTCFRPAYDRGCCDVANGTMSGNVCDIPGYIEGNDTPFRNCCDSISGYSKCK
jgi:hypothetical protein